MADVFKLDAVLGLDSSGFENGLQMAKKGIGTSMKVIGAAVAAGSAAVGAFAKSAVTTGSEFDTSMSQIAATMGLTMDDIKNNVNGAGDTFQALRDKAKEMGSATNFSATEAADGLNILAMSGYDAEHSMAMIEDVLHLAAAGSMDMASAAAYVAGNMKGFNDETKDSGYYADLMAKGATLANTSVQQLGEAMSGGAASAAAYGQTAESMTVSLLRLAEQGEAGSAASTALAAAMKNLYTPTDQAAAALEELGVAAYDENGIARDFNTVVNELAESLNGMSDAEANAYKDTIFGIQGLDAFNKMTVTGIEKQEEWAEALANAGAGAGEAAKQYDTMTDNLKGDIDIFNSSMDGLKIAVSDTLTGSAREFVKFGSNAISRITEGFENGGIDGAMDVLGEVLQDAIKMLTEKLPMFLKVGTKLITAFVQGLVQNAPSIVSAIIDVLPIIIDAFLEMLPDIIEAAAEIILALALGIAKALPDLIPTIYKVVYAIEEMLIDNIDLLVDAAIQIMYGLAEGIISALPIIIEKAPEILMKLGQALFDNLPLLLTALWDCFTSILSAVGGYLAVGWSNLQTWFAGLLNSIGEWLSELPNKMAYWAGYAIGTMVAEFALLPGKIKEWFNKVITKVKEFGADLKQNGKTYAKEFMDNMINGIKELPNKIREIGANVVEGLKNGILEKWEKFKEWWNNLAGGLIDGFKKKFDEHSPSKVFMKIGEYVSEGFGIGFMDGWEDMQKEVNGVDFNLDMSAVKSASAQTDDRTYVIENKIYLEGDAKGVFKLVNQQNRINTRATGRNVLAMT